MTSAQPPLNFTAEAIQSDAAAIAALPMHTTTVHVLPPCGLETASSAASALNKGAEQLISQQDNLAQERDKLCESMNHAAGQYMSTDASAATALHGTVGATFGEGRVAIPDATATATVPGTTTPNRFFPHLPGRPAPAAPSAPDGYSDVPTTEAAFSAPDNGMSLSAGIDAWVGNAVGLLDSADAMPMTHSDWEGAAAEAASAWIRDLKAAMTELAGRWQTLAGQGNGFLNAHNAFKTSHHEVFENYVALKQAWQEAYAAGDYGVLDTINERLNETQQVSDEIRKEYAQAGQLPPGPAPIPRRTRTGASQAPGMPGTPGGGRSPWNGGGYSSGDGNPSAASGPRGGTPSSDQPGDSSGGSAPRDGAQPAATSQNQQPQTPQSPGSPEGESGKGAGQPPSGGMPSGGSPSGGSPSGGGMPGGLPGAGKTGAKPVSPSVRPAGAGAGGKGLGGMGKGAGGGGKGAGGGGRGAGGGGMGGRPMSPAAVAVDASAHAPKGATAGPSAAETGRAPTGAGAGGAGAPMAGHGGGAPGKEKKRSPGLTPDESLYTEDRSWTEGVVGHRRREVLGRREALDDPASKDNT